MNDPLLKVVRAPQTYEVVGMRLAVTARQLPRGREQRLSPPRSGPPGIRLAESCEAIRAETPEQQRCGPHFHRTSSAGYCTSPRYRGALCVWHDQTASPIPYVNQLSGRASTHRQKPGNAPGQLHWRHDAYECCKGPETLRPSASAHG